MSMTSQNDKPVEVRSGPTQSDNFSAFLSDSFAGQAASTA